MYSVAIYQLISIIQILHTLRSDIGTIILNFKEIQPVHPERDQSWVFIRRTDVELKLQYFGRLMQRADSFEKTLMLGKIEGRQRKG